MEYKSLDKIKSDFTKGKFDFPEELLVNGIRYRMGQSYESKVLEMINNGRKTILVYSTPFIEEAKARGLDVMIVLVWGFNNRDKMIPMDVRLSTRGRYLNNLQEAGMDKGNTVTISKERIVGDVVDVVITSIPGTQPMKGKIDTGADVSSMHADSWNISNGQVTFKTPELSEHELTVPVLEKQAIKLSNGDMEYRPVIEMNIRINNVQLTNCMFNLNDRGAMTYPMLIGQNVLEAGKFMVDPTINDPDAPTNEDIEIDWDELMEDINAIDYSETTDEYIMSEDDVRKVIQYINKLPK